MIRYLLLTTLVILTSACGSSPKTNFYMLNSDHSTTEPLAENTNKISLGLWKVKLPELIDRPEIVTRENLYHINLADFHQWAGGLSNNITQLIASELSLKLKTQRVAISPWSSYRKNDYQIKIHISRFDGKLGGESVLNGGWSLLNAKGNKELFRDSFNYQLQATDESYVALVEVQSQLVQKLAKKISESILLQGK